MRSGVCGDPRKEGCTLSTAVHGANNGPRVHPGQGAWLVGGRSLENLPLAALLAGAGSGGEGHVGGLSASS